MKKLWLLLLLPIVILAFGSCKKGDGIFHPDKKLAKIYLENRYVNVQLDTTYYRSLLEIWTWDDDNLVKIEHVYGQFIYFEYDKNDRLKKMQSDNVELTFHYLGGNFNKIEIDQNGGRTTGTYTFKHKNGKISEIKMKLKQVGGGLGKSAEMKELTDLLSFFMPEQVTQALCTTTTEALKAADAKGTPTVTFTTTMELEWDADDVSKATINETHEDSWGNSKKHKTVITCQYDTKQNPYYNLFNSSFNITGLSKHNVLYSKTESSGPASPYISNYSYEYEGTYPISQGVFNPNGDMTGYSYYTCYEYKK